MTDRRARLRSAASADIVAAVSYLHESAGERATLTFIDTVEGGIDRLVGSPHLGSLRFAYETGIPDLRAWTLRRVPYVIFYIDHPDGIDVWRVLHTRRDIPASFSDTT